MELAGDGRPRQQALGSENHRSPAKKIGRENVSTFLFDEAGKVIRQADLSKGKSYLEPDWNFISLCTWFDLKFHIKLDHKQFDADMPREKVRKVLLDHVVKLYHEKEIEFPVTVAMARFMNDQGQGGSIGQKYNREGLYHWYRCAFGSGNAAFRRGGGRARRARHHGGTVPHRFAGQTQRKADRNQPARVSQVGHDDIDIKLNEAFAGARSPIPKTPRKSVRGRKPSPAST